jgi:hypothetical protein
MKRVRSVYEDAMYLGGRKIRKDVVAELDDDEFTVWRATKVHAVFTVEAALRIGAITLVDEAGNPIPYEPPPAPTLS